MRLIQRRAHELHGPSGAGGHRVTPDRTRRDKPAPTRRERQGDAPGRQPVSRPGFPPATCVRVLCSLVPACLAVLCGCASPEPAPPPFVGPRATSSLSYYVGSPLSGPQGVKAGAPVETENLVIFEVTTLALERWGPASTVGSSLASKARLLTVGGGNRPLKPLPRLTALARVSSAPAPDPIAGQIGGGELGRTAPIAQAQGGLAPGVTAVCEVRGKVGEELSVSVYRPPGAGAETLQAAVKVRGLRAAPEDPEDASKVEGGARDPEEEAAILDPFPVGEAHALSVLLPSPFSGEPGEAVAILITAHPAGPDDPSAQAPELARALADLSRVGTSPALAASARLERFAAGLPPALQGLVDPVSRRPALLHLAEASGASLTADFALVGDRQALEALCALIAERVSKRDGVEKASAMAYFLDGTTLSYLASQLAKDLLSPELSSVLLNHTGQAGRQVTSLEDAVRASKSLESLRARIVEENWVALEDNSPSARVRAFDWLRERGDAPPDFDPLAPPAERRKSLEKAFAARTAAAETPSAAPGPVPSPGKAGAPVSTVPPQAR